MTKREKTRRELQDATGLVITDFATTRGEVEALITKRRANLANLTVVGADLTGLNFRAARLTNARFINCKLNGANLRHAIMTYTIVRGCDLTDADLTNADTFDAKFDN